MLSLISLKNFNQRSEKMQKERKTIKQDKTIILSISSVVSAARQASCPSPTPRACSNSCPLSRWYYLTISSSLAPFSSCLQSFPASESFPVSQLFPSGGQSTGASASVSVLPMNIQGWFPLRLTGLISLLSKGLSGVFFSTTVLKHQ